MSMVKPITQRFLLFEELHDHFEAQFFYKGFNITPYYRHSDSTKGRASHIQHAFNETSFSEKCRQYNLQTFQTMHCHYVKERSQFTNEDN